MVGSDSTSRSSSYVDPAHGVQPQYRELRPVIATSMAVCAAGAGAGVAVGALTQRSAEALSWSGSDGQVSGAQLNDTTEAWERRKRQNNVALGTAAGLGVVTLGLGVWYVTTF